MGAGRHLAVSADCPPWRMGAAVVYFPPFSSLATSRSHHEQQRISITATTSSDIKEVSILETIRNVQTDRDFSTKKKPFNKLVNQNEEERREEEEEKKELRNASSPAIIPSQVLIPSLTNPASSSNSIIQSFKDSPLPSKPYTRPCFYYQIVSRQNRLYQHR